MSQKLEIWTIAQKWITMSENMKKEGKKRKGGEKDEKNEKRRKQKIREQNSKQSLNKLFKNGMYE